VSAPNITFSGWVEEQQRRDLFTRCRAFLFPGNEDFGITPLEAMAAGRPVIAYAAGGALETVIDGVTGRFFHQQSAAALAAAVAAARCDDYDSRVIRQHAENFGQTVFLSRIQAFIDTVISGGREENQER
jgi:glycosyltransferase involved in cell wall biosynthesis